MAVDFQLFHDKTRISDVPSNAVTLIDTGTAIYALTWSRLLELVAGSIQTGGAGTFAELTDVLFTYAGNDGKLLAVHAPGTGTPGIKLVDPLTVDQYITSNGLNPVQGKAIYEALLDVSRDGHGHEMAEVAGLIDALQALQNDSIDSAVYREGNVIKFDAKAIYNFSAPTTGAITFDFADALLMKEVLLVCDENTTFPAELTLYGALVVGTNYVSLRALSDTLVIGKVYDDITPSMSDYWTIAQTQTGIQGLAENGNFTPEAEMQAWWGFTVSTIRTAIRLLGVRLKAVQEAFSNYYTKAETLSEIETKAELADFTTDDTTWWGAGVLEIRQALLVLKTKIGESGSAISSFLGLGDTPSSYAGQAGKVATVNATEDGLEFTDKGAATDLTNYYTKSETNAAITDLAELGEFTANDTTWWGAATMSINAAFQKVKEKIQNIRQVPAGTAGQVVGFDTQGNPIAQDAPSGGAADAATTTYTPADPTNYSNYVNPYYVNLALDELISRARGMEGNSGNVYYVAPNADNTIARKGSLGNPYTIDQAVSLAVAGDSIVFITGSYTINQSIAKYDVSYGTIGGRVRITTNTKLFDYAVLGYIVGNPSSAVVNGDFDITVDGVGASFFYMDDTTSSNGEHVVAFSSVKVVTGDFAINLPRKAKSILIEGSISIAGASRAIYKSANTGDYESGRFNVNISSTSTAPALTMGFKNVTITGVIKTTSGPAFNPGSYPGVNVIIMTVDQAATCDSTIGNGDYKLTATGGIYRIQNGNTVSLDGYFQNCTLRGNPQAKVILYGTYVNCTLHSNQSADYNFFGYQSGGTIGQVNSGDRINYYGRGTGIASFSARNFHLFGQIAMVVDNYISSENLYVYGILTGSRAGALIAMGNTNKVEVSGKVRNTSATAGARTIVLMSTTAGNKIRLKGAILQVDAVATATMETTQYPTVEIEVFGRSYMNKPFLKSTHASAVHNFSIGPETDLITDTEVTIE